MLARTTALASIGAVLAVTVRLSRLRGSRLTVGFALACLLASALEACGGGGGRPDPRIFPNYTIGGQLFGLAAGEQVVLHNNSTDSLTLAANGSFTFTRMLELGSAYDVTVVTQPAGQTCVVSAGSGVNLTANVTNVLVNCSANTTSVGGTLVGLGSGQQVTVQNNGADPLVLTADGPFTFSALVASGGSYGVTVSAQPSQASGQFCSIRNGTGFAVADVTDVRVVCDTEAVLFDFTLANQAGGANPSGGLTMDAAGNLYGTTAGGGSFGVVFRLSPAAGGGYTETVLYDFPGSQAGSNVGATPVGGVILDSAGNIYGTTSDGGVNTGGVLFKLTPSPGGGYTASALHSFDGGSADGGHPTGYLILDAAGNIYGAATIGGSGYGGIVFRISTSGAGYTILHAFTGGNDGGGPQGGLIMDGAGNLYGTTAAGGSGSGVVYKLAPGAGGTYTESVLHYFGGFGDGDEPMAGLIMDSAGNLYGTTEFGSTNAGPTYGTVFMLSPAAGGVYNETILYSFTGGADGQQPLANLVMDSAGNLYGTTSGVHGSTCSAGCGTVFELVRGPTGGYTESVLFGFSGDSGGAGPGSGLLLDSAGNLYGTTTGGTTFDAPGAYQGNVFELLVH